jgi:hypothetical protein
LAWKEQCKIAFCSDVNNLVGMEKKKYGAVTRVIKKLHRESGIPLDTLWRWYNESRQKVTVKNGCNSEQAPDYSKEMCCECEKQPVYLTPSGKPIGEISKYYGLCKNCKDYKSHLIGLDNIKDDSDGLETVCPNCHQVHLINKKRLQKGG